MRHLRLALMLFTLMAAFGASKVQATLVAYTYTGNNFNTISGTGITTSDFLSGSIIVDCGLLGGAGDCASLPLANYIPAITRFSFSGAGVTIDDSTSFLLVGMFSTDATGMIIDWNIQSQNAVPSFATISGPSCYTFYDSCDQLSTLNGTGYTFDDLGAWSATVVPIPATLWLFGSGLLGLIGIARRNRLNRLVTRRPLGRLFRWCCMSEFGRKYAFIVSVSTQGSGDRERQVTARTRSFRK